jgi:hypothetical protein
MLLLVGLRHVGTCRSSKAPFLQRRVSVQASHRDAEEVRTRMGFFPVENCYPATCRPADWNTQDFMRVLYGEQACSATPDKGHRRVFTSRHASTKGSFPFHGLPICSRSLRNEQTRALMAGWRVENRNPRTGVRPYVQDVNVYQRGWMALPGTKCLAFPIGEWRVKVSMRATSGVKRSTGAIRTDTLTLAGPTKAETNSSHPRESKVG